jgi:hypothetical protein
MAFAMGARRFLAVLGAVLGCGGESEPAPTCSPRWELGDAASPDMSPGKPCVGCHLSNGGPPLAAAGTVFASLGAEDDCYGVAGLTVEIEDAAGTVHTVSTGPSGNFQLEGDPLVLPIIARVIDGDRQRWMPRYVHATDCNGCHTRQGAEGAPGRILAP